MRLRRAAPRAIALAAWLATTCAASELEIASPASSATTTIDAVSLDRLIDAEHAAQRFDGVVLVGRGDAILYRRAIGLADREAGTPHRVDETWRWASVSKQVAAVLAMQRMQAGTLSLDDTLAVRLPDFKAPNAARVTIRQLLQHTSGLPNPDDTSAPKDGLPAFYTTRHPSAREASERALEFCAGTPKATPGETFSYDNCDTLVLQALLERDTRRPYAALLRERITAPLALRSLGLFGFGKRDATRTPVGYIDDKREPPFELANFGAAGALYGSADDLWRFDRALLDHTLLDAASTKTLWTGVPALGYVALGAWSFEAPLAGCTGAVKLVERRGEIGGVQVRNLIAPDLKAALVVFSNTSATDFGEIWQGKGLTHALASAAFCGKAQDDPAR